MDGFGITTIACGGKKYYEMASALLLSIKLRDRNLPTAVITDEPGYFEGMSDHVIAPGGTYSSNCLIKLYLDEYSPFQKTLFVDADCFFIRSIVGDMKRFAGHDFAVNTERLMTAGHWYADVERWRRRLSVPYIPKFNGGMIWFAKGPASMRVFADARDMIPRYDEFGFTKFRGWICDEPLIASAMALNGNPGVPDNGELFDSPMDCRGSLSIDVLAGSCEFVKDDMVRRPKVIHFNAGYCSYFHYRREYVKLLVASRCGFLTQGIISLSIDCLYNPAYVVETILRRAKRLVLNRKRFRWLPLMPISRYW